MYVVDITRINKENFETDLIVGKNSMNTKMKIINYIHDYTLANYNINIEKEDLDYGLNLDLFSLKKFLIENNNSIIENDLIIQSIRTDKNNCLFVKKYSPRDEYPIVYILNKNDVENAKKIMTFLINDSLINSLANKNQLDNYDELKQDYNKNSLSYFVNGNEKVEIVSLYKDNLLIEQLLNNNISLNQVNLKSGIKI